MAEPILGGENPPRYQDSDVGPIPVDWAVVSLGDVLKEVNARAAAEAGGASFPVLSLTKDYGLIPQEEKFKKRVAKTDVSDYKIVRHGWIAYNPYVIWEGAIHARTEESSGLVSPAYVVWRAVDADWEFLHFLFRAGAVIERISRLCSGAVNRRRSISKRDFASVRVALPPLQEQRAIARVLRTVRRAKEATERVISSTQELKKSLVTHLFSYGPTPVGGADQVPLAETEIGPITKHWKLAACDDICEQVTVGVVVKPSSYYVPSGVPAFRSFNVQEDRLVTNNLVYFSEEANKGKLAKSRLRRGDVLIVRTGNPGVSCVVPSAFEGSNCIDLVIARPNDRVVSDYLSRYFNSPAARQQTLRSKTGLAQQHLNVGAVKRTLIPVPPHGEQERIAGMLAVVDAKLAAEEDRAQALDALFHSMLQELMTGNTRVVPRDRADSGDAD